MASLGSSLVGAQCQASEEADREPRSISQQEHTSSLLEGTATEQGTQSEGARRSSESLTGHDLSRRECITGGISRHAKEASCSAGGSPRSPAPWKEESTLGGTPVVLRAPYESPIPQRRAKSARREVLMNNPNERTPFQNNLQASSKDPLGFIYSTYWAAQKRIEEITLL